MVRLHEGVGEPLSGSFSRRLPPHPSGKAWLLGIDIFQAYTSEGLYRSGILRHVKTGTDASPRMDVVSARLIRD